MIGVWTLNYPPRRFIGSELMTHQLVKAVQAAGTRVKVATAEKPGNWSHEGIQVAADLSDCNLLILHTDMPRVSWSRRIPCQIGICHNAEAGVQLALHTNRFELVVCNSEIMRAELEARDPHPYIVVRPPAPKPGKLPTNPEFVTIVNVNENKAGPFWEIAKRLRNTKFLVVKGGYGDQHFHRLPNVTVIDPVPHHLMFEKVWSRTRLLLAPSTRESWNMTAGEAISHGIPVISSDIPAVRENLGSAAIYLDQKHVGAWLKAIKHAPAPSNRVRARAASNRTRHLLDVQRFVEEVVALGDRHDKTGINHHG